MTEAPEETPWRVAGSTIHRSMPPASLGSTHQDTMGVLCESSPRLTKALEGWMTPFLYFHE